MGSSLFNFGAPFPVLVMQRDLGNLQQVEILPFDAVALLISDLQIPVGSLFLRAEGDVHALAAGQRVASENVFAPIVLIVRRNIEAVNLHARLVMQGEILLSAFG